jgi:1,2-diacylglycerol 3-alpha-glucosyltransferase
MNIGIVTTWFPVGAGYVSKAYRAILAEKHNVFIYARGGKNMFGNADWDDERVYWAPHHYHGIKTRNMLKWCSKNKIEILFFNEQTYWKPVIAAKKAGICIGAYIDYYKQVTVKAFKLYDFVICNTLRHYSVFNWHNHSFYIPWGTDIDKFKPAAEKADRKLTFIMNLGWEGEYSLDRKGLLLGTKAFHNVKGDCQLIIYSQVEFSKCLLTWQEHISSDNRIKFIYGTFDPFPYNEGDVYLYPSRLDGIGLSLPEALSCGLPSITTDSPPMNEFVKSGINGQLVSVEKYLGRYDGYYWAESLCSIDSLTQTMQMYVDDQNMVNKQKQAARDIAESQLNWVVNSINLTSIFENSIFNKCDYDEELVSFALYLDRLMRPSFNYKFLSLLRDYAKYHVPFLFK